MEKQKLEQQITLEIEELEERIAPAHCANVFEGLTIFPPAGTDPIGPILTVGGGVNAADGAIAAIAANDAGGVVCVK